MKAKLFLTFLTGYVLCAGVRNYVMYAANNRIAACTDALITAVNAGENDAEATNKAFAEARVCHNNAQFSTFEKALMLYYKVETKTQE